jgi:hypothetical protein
MRTTKIRTAGAMLAATFAVAIATAPIAQDAHAAVNNGGYQQSGEAKRKQFCQTLEDSFDAAKANYKRAMWRGNKKQAKQIQKSIDGLQVLGEANGCSWAA